jgi:hypothetical protein
MRLHPGFRRKEIAIVPAFREGLRRMAFFRHGSIAERNTAYPPVSRYPSDHEFGNFLLSFVEIIDPGFVAYQID